MKIPDDKIMVLDGSDDIYKACKEIAAMAFVEHGVYVDVKVVTISNNPISYPMISEIYFTIGDHRFDTAKDLRKALKNKAFL